MGEHTRGRIILVGDAEGVLQSVVKMAAKAKVINEIAKEVALHLAPLGLTLSGVHIWGEENCLADALSRLNSGEPIPPELVNVPRDFPPFPFRWRSLCSFCKDDSN